MAAVKHALPTPHSTLPTPHSSRLTPHASRLTPHAALPCAQVKRALERSVSKDSKQEAKRLEAQAVCFAQCRTLLHFIQVRREW